MDDSVKGCNVYGGSNGFLMVVVDQHFFVGGLMEEPRRD